MRRLSRFMLIVFCTTLVLVGTAYAVGQAAAGAVLTYEVMGDTHLRDIHTQTELILFEDRSDHTIAFVNQRGKRIFSLLVAQPVYEAMQGKQFVVQPNTADPTTVDVLWRDDLRDTTQPLLRSLRLDEFFSADLSPDGRWLVILNVETVDVRGAHRGAYVIDLHTGAHIKMGTSRRQRPDWSPNGDWVTLINYDSPAGTVLQYADLRRGLVYETPYLVNAHQWSPDGRYLFAEGYDGWEHLHAVIDVNAETTRRLPDERTFTRIRWSPTGEHLMFLLKSDTQVEIYLYTLADDQFGLLATVPLAVSVQDILWDSYGEVIVYRTTHPTDRNITLMHHIDIATGADRELGRVAYRAWQPSLLHGGALQDLGCRLTGCGD